MPAVSSLYPELACWQPEAGPQRIAFRPKQYPRAAKFHETSHEAVPRLLGLGVAKAYREAYRDAYSHSAGMASPTSERDAHGRREDKGILSLLSPINNHNENGSCLHLSPPDSHTPRTKLHNAATVSPTVSATPANAQNVRDRASTLPKSEEGAILHHRDPPSFSSRRRAESTHSSKTLAQRTPLTLLAPLRIDLKAARYAQPSNHLQSVPESEIFLLQLSATQSPLKQKVPGPGIPDTRSKPIPIPRHSKIGSEHPVIPLTARPRPPAYLSDRASKSRTPDDSPHSSYSSDEYEYVQYPDTRPKSRKSFSMSPRPGQKSTFRPSSPLAKPIAIPPNENQQKARQRRAATNLNLSGLPKYHPANFPTSQDNTPLSPRSAGALSAQNPSRLGSDAQQKLHKYQRDVVASATRRSGMNLAKPTSPRLIPMGSPAEAMTPMMLEGQGDYLTAGSNMSPSAFKNEQEARKMVEQMVQKENERRSHPEARAGSLSPAVSPAVSPRV